MERKKKILIFPVGLITNNQYIPNLIRNLSDEFDFLPWDVAWKKFGLGVLQSDIIFLNWIEAIKGNNSELVRILSYLGRAALVKYFELSGKPIVWTCHDKLSHERQKDKYVHRLMMQTAKAASRIHCLCKATMELPEIAPYKDKCIVIPHGDYFGNYGKTGQNLREKYNIPESSHVLLFIGLVKRYKNIEILLDSFAKAVEESGRKDVVLFIVGKSEPPEYHKQLLERLKSVFDQVRFELSFIKDEEMADYLELADALVAPYPLRSMLNSGTFWMACSYACPMIIPEIGGVCDNDERQKAGWFYRYDDESQHREALKSAILEFFEDLKDPEKMKSKANEALAWMERNSWKNNIERWKGLFRF